MENQTNLIQLNNFVHKKGKFIWHQL